MKRFLPLSLAALALFCLSSSIRGQEFSQVIDGPDELLGLEGDTVTGTFTAVARDSEDNEENVQGWSISLSANNLNIDSITTAGTDAEALFMGGFEKSETTPVEGGGPSRDECEGRNGAVSAVVLSFTMPIVLPSGDSSIASLEVSGIIPDGEGEASIAPANGCRGSGQPVDNNFTVGGQTVKPELVGKDVKLVELECFCLSSLAGGFSAEVIASDEPFEGIAGVDITNLCSAENPEGNLCTADGGVQEIEGRAGELTSGTTWVNVVQQGFGEGQGVQGWSFSIGFTPASGSDLLLVDASVEGTRAAPVPDGLWNGGFEKTEVVNADDPINNGQQGAVSAVVLSFTMPIVLPNGTSSVLGLTTEGTVPAEDDGGEPSGGGASEGSFSFRNGLKGSGQPVNNVLTVGGGSNVPANLATAAVTVKLVPPSLVDFIRGNANDDRRVDIADPIWTINELFRDGPPSPCQDAADANDDGMVDLSDAVYSIDYLFLAGALPGAPFPECGFDPSDEEGEGDGIGCDSAVSCD